MSEVGLGFLANVAVIGVVSYIIIFRVVDRICRCIENVNASKLMVGSMGDSGNMRTVSAIMNFADKMNEKEAKKQNVR